VPELIVCPRCGIRWSGLGAAHCCAAGCGRLFATARLFDLHRHARGDHGGCLDPVTLVTARTGDRVMFLRDGMWRNPEMPPERRERFAALAAAQKASRLRA
jgi:hypothetical protein